MALTDDLCGVHKRRSGISSGMKYKRCVDSSKWSEHKKQKNEIYFECGRRNVEKALDYFKQTYASKMTKKQAENP